MKEKKLKKRWIVLIAIVAIIIASRIKGYINETVVPNQQTYHWPTSALAKKLPKPKSDRGEVTTDSDTILSVDVRKTTQADFEDYIEQCREKGFTVDYGRSSTSYSAETEEKYELSLYYNEDTKTMDIQACAPEKEDFKKKELKKTKSQSKTVKKYTTKKKKTTNKTRSTGVSPKFKKMMDSYEEFFDEYIKFMKKYKKSSNPASLMSDYADYMEKYAKYMEELEGIENEDLNVAELAYYTKVNARIMEKISELNKWISK